MIRFCTFNIRNGRNGGLESALCGVSQGLVYCGVLNETKLTKLFYTREYSGFLVMATEATSVHRGGIAVFYREAEHFAIEELRLHGPNFIISHLVTGRRR